MGDWNSRVGLRNDFISFDHYNKYNDYDNYIPDCPSLRASPDSTCNSFGMQLIELCKSSGVRIVNGRLDKGSFTYISDKGSSVIDYLLTEKENFYRISNFNVLDFNIWSDHVPIRFSLYCNLKNNVVKDRKNMHVFRWDDLKKARFRNGVISLLPLFNNTI